ncbi:MAG: Asp-tRNA(Asn)/Glu-tRNA(Gln) amidotransferase GatCAB subunit A [Candidatus Yanofskybacteria bacterium CG10_big_fil_rev_8_21_14_0_10_46_23]|uniref:Glutamyl-tRNA(Gln) amidotransferase subunit A n=1 Tax=Candidatus Yanofskybacteria bacterium CG10_big_fil_rev_8_21_14_0_10_46_23 TaxID=1975098 RepID=A0A2H0R461_9BACT|nr:MAG: Asp-tRNA(Asn)/Glu-tRNA(Gln) amidotransferase GatCAB subunit A [Candidatus Yanofskybacteria bacterium CG10_big_fil_rev_8_21_14_0_10_46_23]
MELANLTIKRVQAGLSTGEFTATELQQELGDFARQKDKDLHAFLSFSDPEAQIREGSLANVPIAVKDNILIAGGKTTAASKILENYVAPYDATAISRLRVAGAWFQGKTNLDEFAMGASTENSAFGATRNPHDPTRVAGGSSGGSAAAVASGQAVAALGSDTGGSIRLPASFCGVVGLKPTYGRVSRHGLIAMASSFDQIGPITKTVEDAAILLAIIAGQDELDATSALQPIEDYEVRLREGVVGKRIGVPTEFFAEGLDPAVAKVVKKAITELEALGARVGEITLPHTKYAVPTYYILVPSEVSANVARYDGIKYGLSVQSENLLDTYLDSRAQGFGAEVRRRIILGTYVLSSGYFEAYYAKAQKVRRLIKEDFDKAFENFDVIVGPTAPTPAFKIGEKSDPVSMYLQDIYTAPASLAGIPAISIPCGQVEGLPVGLQIMGRQFDEATVLATAYAYEQR